MRNSALAALPSAREPTGNWTVSSTDPELPRTRFAAAASTRRTPSAYAAVIRSAALTSRPLAGSAGRTSTVVSARSAAMSWTRPAGMSMTAVIGLGVLNFCITFSGVSLLFLTLETLRCIHGSRNKLVAH